MKRHDTSVTLAASQGSTYLLTLLVRYLHFPIEHVHAILFDILFEARVAVETRRQHASTKDPISGRLSGTEPMLKPNREIRHVRSLESGKPIARGR